MALQPNIKADCEGDGIQQKTFRCAMYGGTLSDPGLIEQRWHHSQWVLATSNIQQALTGLGYTVRSHFRPMPQQIYCAGKSLSGTRLCRVKNGIRTRTDIKMCSDIDVRPSHMNAE
jgi:hypothetical protein